MTHKPELPEANGLSQATQPAPGVTLGAKPLDPKRERIAAYLANIQQIRVNRWFLYHDKDRQTSTNTTRADATVKLPATPNREYVITHISAVDLDNTTTTTAIYRVSGETEYLLNRDVPSAAAVSVDWAGQIICAGGDRITAAFYVITSGDWLEVHVQGYWVEK